jgi:VanZ family protein
VRPALRLWLPVLAWAALIFALSAIPSLSSGLGGWDLVLRKAAHITEFAILGALLVRALGTAAPAFVVSVAYAASDEWHQSFVRGREGRPLDVAIDVVGVLAGVLAWRRLQRAARSRSTAPEAAAGPTTSHAP